MTKALVKVTPYCTPYDEFFRPTEGEKLISILLPGVELVEEVAVMLCRAGIKRCRLVCFMLDFYPVSGMPESHFYGPDDKFFVDVVSRMGA